MKCEPCVIKCEKRLNIPWCLTGFVKSDSQHVNDIYHRLWSRFHIMLITFLITVYLQGVPENMRHADFFNSYMRSYKNTRSRLKDLIKFNQIFINLAMFAFVEWSFILSKMPDKFPSRFLSFTFFGTPCTTCEAQTGQRKMTIKDIIVIPMFVKLNLGGGAGAGTSGLGFSTSVTLQCT